MADEVGLSRLTLAGLAARLGVSQPSLYKHIDGMDGLQRGLAIRAKNELAAILARAAIGRERGDAITASAHAYWLREDDANRRHASAALNPSRIRDPRTRRSLRTAGRHRPQLYSSPHSPIGPTPR
jgi:AcrR family transcriptional regulator